MIELKNVSKQYTNQAAALTGVTLKIDAGEFVYLVGPSGAGKSTLLKLLYRQLQADSGRLQVSDFDLKTIKPKQIPYLRRKIGIVFQDFKLLPNLTIFENVAYAMEVIGASDEAIQNRVTEVLELVGLGQKAQSFPDELSGGQQQRVSIARGIVNRPDILITDEPTGNLDPQKSQEILALLELINQKYQTTIIMATHDENLVDNSQHRVIGLEGGKLVRDEQAGDYHA